MLLCSSQSIRSVLVVCSGTLLVAQGAASESTCDAVTEAIKTGVLQETDTIRACTRAADVKALADLVELAIEYRQGPVAEALLKSGEQIVIGAELVHFAALFDQANVLKYLLAQRPDLLEARDESGSTPLVSAALGRAFRSARILLESGAREDIGQALAIAVSRSPEIAYLIMERRPGWHTNEAVAGDVLGAAIEYNYPPLLQFILDSGVSPNVRDPEGYHVLLHAPQHKTRHVGEYNWGFMVRHGADEREAVCSLSKDEMDHAVEFAPDWYARKVSSLRTECPPVD